ncbi:MAG: nitroreductase family protein [Opitutaceae bacterium]
MASESDFKKWSDYRRVPVSEMRETAQHLFEELSRRRSVREFSSETVPREVIESCLRTAGTAPSGANRQPWHFVVVENPDVKKRIRDAAEQEERAFYGGRAPDEWLRAVQPFGTTSEKPFLETAPVLIAVFAQSHRTEADQSQSRNYYVNESVGLAAGFLVSCLHLSGLACLVHTPSPMGFLNQILDRPKSERAYLLLVVGYPAEDVKVPALSRRPFAEIVTFR